VSSAAPANGLPATFLTSFCVHESKLVNIILPQLLADIVLIIIKA
jgi:hypothetical protein